MRGVSCLGKHFFKRSQINHQGAHLTLNTTHSRSRHAQALEFGDVPSHAWADQIVTLHNTSSMLPVTFEVQGAPSYFKVQPSAGEVLAMQTFQVRFSQSKANAKAVGPHAAFLVARLCFNAHCSSPG